MSLKQEVMLCSSSGMPPLGALSTAETKCAGSRLDSVPVGLREKGYEHRATG